SVGRSFVVSRVVWGIGPIVVDGRSGARGGGVDTSAAPELRQGSSRVGAPGSDGSDRVRQLRRMVRGEALLMAVYGAMFGMALGLALGGAAAVVLFEEMDVEVTGSGGPLRDRRPGRRGGRAGRRRPPPLAGPRG